MLTKTSRQTSVRLLREAGWDVGHVREHHAGISDAEVLALAVRESRALLTFDRDFEELVFHKGMTCPSAVVYLRVVPATPATPAEPAELLLAIVLCGGDKSSQQRDIARAQGYLADWKARQRR